MTNDTPFPTSTGAFTTEDNSVKMQDQNIQTEESGANKSRLENTTPTA